MEKKLKELFEYQRFEKNARLEKMVREAELRCARELSMDELECVTAAGEIGVLSKDSLKPLENIRPKQ